MNSGSATPDDPVVVLLGGPEDAPRLDLDRVASAFDGSIRRAPPDDIPGGIDCLLLPYPAPGEESFETIRDRFPGLPVIALVGDGDAAAAIDAGATDCFAGEEETVLAARIENAIRARRATERTDDLRAERDRIEDMFEAVMRHAPISIYFKDAEARHVRVSDHQVENLRGQERPDGTVIEDREDVLGLTDPEIYPEEVAKSSYEDDLQVIETGEPIRRKVEQWNRSNVEWYSTTKIPRRNDDGEVVGLVGFTIDIVDRKRSQRLEEFVDVISHDLRNPLNVAQGELDLLQRGSGEGDLDSLAASLDQMQRFLDELLDLAREGRTVGKLEPIDTAEAIRSAWASVDAPAATLEAHWDDRILADETRFVELLSNLFRNAVEHAGPEVTVEVGPIEEGFFVADDGPGISADDPESVFEWGHTTGGGTGFGLAIVREIAMGHGWDVKVTESDAGGARFEFRGVESV